MSGKSATPSHENQRSQATLSWPLSGSTSRPSCLLPLGQVRLDRDRPICVDGLTPVPLPLLALLGPSHILNVPLAASFPLLDLLVREASLLEPGRPLLLPLLAVPIRLKCFVPVACVRFRLDVHGGVVALGEATVHGRRANERREGAAAAVLDRRRRRLARTGRREGPDKFLERVRILVLILAAPAACSSPWRFVVSAL